MANYKDAGVNLQAGYETVKLIGQHIKNSYRPEVISDIGGFGGFFLFNKDKYNEPVLVSGADGVGTKLKIAFLMDKHDTIGIDCVAMCVNDIICSGAEPLFFLDYIALGKNRPEKTAQIVKGVADGCIEAGCSLIGGETAEMPGCYPADEYDIAGFAVGVVEKNKIIDGKSIKEGDHIIGLSSSGLHSNGYSLVRKILNPRKDKLNEKIEAFGTDLGTELIKPTKIYVKTILDLINRFEIKGVSNITGGGFIENIPRMIPEGLRVTIKKGSWPVLPVFDLLNRLGSIKEEDMFNTFNMGIGMTLAVDANYSEEVLKYINAKQADSAYLIGQVIKGESGVDIC